MPASRLWREEGNHIRRGPFPPPVPEVSIRELSVQPDGDGITYLKIEPLHAPAIVFETGDARPHPASSPVPTPTRFEATGLRYRFLAYDPADMVQVSAVKEWTAKLRLKYQLHNRGDHYEVELLALPKANGISHPLHHRRFLAHQYRLGHLRRGIPRPRQLPHCLRHGRDRLRAEL
jgi:hypothetical protein